jgi:Zn finger protein HypA/HybF involved in hydrogenase expression
MEVECMAKKIICESCGTAFKFELAKDMDVCPVCGDSLNDEDMEVNSSDEDEGLMYCDDINIFDENPQNSFVRAYCTECGENNFFNLKFFDKCVAKQYVILKPDVILKCKNCDREHKPRKIIYKKKDYYEPPLTQCPLCGSLRLKKISGISKFATAAMLGAFAPFLYDSKTYECQNCGHLF